MMKLKVRPEDFRVEELIHLRLRSNGPYSIYRLEKQRWNTLDVLDFVARQHHLRRLSRAGLKDRYSRSIQYVSAQGAGPRLIREKDFNLKLIGRSDVPVTRDLLRGNRFGITLRDMTEEETSAVESNLPAVMSDGFANYYDEQRFGSARHGEGFFAHRLILGHFNGALKLYLATPSAFDDRDARRRKQFMNEHWGDWALCLKDAKAEYAPVLRHLGSNPKDFEGAVRRIKPDLLELFLNSYQSYLWNETLSALILSFGLKTQTVAIAQSELPFYLELNPEARKFFGDHRIPAPGQGTEFTDERIERVMNVVLLREGLTLKDLKPALRIRGIFFKPFSRPGVVIPEEMKVSRPEPDELYAGRQKLVLSFMLPPGAYATILIKRLAFRR
jgi:tRNA pseudouridine13 synthase